jgi:hypothetical protein
MTHEKVRRILIPGAVCVALLGMLLVLTANLDDITLGPGRASPKNPSVDESGAMDGRGGLRIDAELLRHLLFVAFTVSLTIVLLGALFTRFLRRWLYFAIGLFGALIVFDMFASKLPSRIDIEPEDAATDQVVVASAEPGSSQWGRVLIAVGLSLGTGAALVLSSSWIVARWRAYCSCRGNRKLRSKLEWLAERTLASRRNTDLVLRCYREMVDLLARNERIPHASLTAREFADRLRNLGLHTEAIDGLTELFELVRYGHRDSAPFSERAVASLDRIRRRHPPHASIIG